LLGQIFEGIDLKSTGSIDREELTEATTATAFLFLTFWHNSTDISSFRTLLGWPQVFGEDTVVLVQRIKGDRNGLVSPAQWNVFLRRIELRRGEQALDHFLGWAGRKVDEWRSGRPEIAAAIERRRLFAEASAKLHGKVHTRVDRGRLEARGLLREKADPELPDPRETAKRQRVRALEAALTKSTRPRRDDLIRRGLVRVPQDEEEVLLESYGWRCIKTMGGQTYWHNALSGELVGDKPDCEAPRPKPREDFAWRSRAESIFLDVDLNSNETLDRDELTAVFGGDAYVIFHDLEEITRDAQACHAIGLSHWMAYCERMKENHGLGGLQSFLSFCEAKLEAYLIAQSRAAALPACGQEEEEEARSGAELAASLQGLSRREHLVAMEAMSPREKGSLRAHQDSEKVAKQERAVKQLQKESLIADLEKLYATRVSRDRLEQRGLVKASREEVAVRRMGQKQAGIRLERHLATRPDREFMEQKGRIRSVQAHQEQKERFHTARNELERQMNSAFSGLSPRGGPNLDLAGEEPEEEDASVLGSPELDALSESLFSELDLDKDGLIQREELLTIFGKEGAVVLLRNLDANHDGNVSHEEWTRFLTSLRQLELTSGGHPVESFLAWASEQAIHHRGRLELEDAAATGKQRRVEETKACLEAKLSPERRVDRGRLVERGTIVSEETTKKRANRIAEATYAVEEALVNDMRPKREELVGWGVIQEIERPPHVPSKRSREWRPRSENVFALLDLDHNGELSLAELEATLGPANLSSGLLQSLLPSDDSGKVGAAEWVRFCENLLQHQGQEALGTFFTFCEDRIAEYGKGRNARSPRSAKAAGAEEAPRSPKSPEFRAKEVRLEGLFDRQLDRDRLVDRGTLKQSSLAEVQELGREDVKARIERHLQTQPDKERLVERGTVRDPEEYRETLKERQAFAIKLNVKLQTRPDRERLEQRGLIQNRNLYEVRSLEKANLKESLAHHVEHRVERDRLEERHTVKTSETNQDRKEALEQVKQSLEEQLTSPERKTYEEHYENGLFKGERAARALGRRWYRRVETAQRIAQGRETIEAKLDRRPAREELLRKGILRDEALDQEKRREMEAVKLMLEGKMSLNEAHGGFGDLAGREWLEAKGKIRDQFSGYEGWQQAAAFEEHLAQRPDRREALVARGVLPAEGQELSSEAEGLPAKRWRERAESVFDSIDLDHDKSLSRDEVVAVFGGAAVALLKTLLTDDAHYGAVGLREWLLFLEGILERHDLTKVHTFLSFCEERVASHLAAIAIERHREEMIRAKNPPAKEVLEARLTSPNRPDRERLVARGILRSTDDHAEKAERFADAASSLEASLLHENRPKRQELEDKGLLQPEAKREEYRPPQGHATNWRDRAEFLFSELDTDRNGGVSREKILAVFQGDSMQVFRRLLTDPEWYVHDGEVRLTNWMRYMEGVKEARGWHGLEALLGYCEGKLFEHHHERDVARFQQRRAREAWHKARSGGILAQAVALGDKLERRVERHRLQERGVLKTQAEHQTRSLGVEQTRVSLEHALAHRRPKDRVLQNAQRGDSTEAHRAKQERLAESKAKLHDDLKQRPSAERVAAKVEGYSEAYDWKARSVRLFGPKRNLVRFDPKNSHSDRGLAFSHRRHDSAVERDKALIIAAVRAPPDAWGGSVLSDGFAAMARDCFEAAEDASVRLGKCLVLDAPCVSPIDLDEIPFSHQFYDTVVAQHSHLARSDKLELHTRVMELAERYHETTLQAKALVNIGILHQTSGDLRQAESSLKEAIRRAEITEDRLTIGRAHAPLAELYRSRGMMAEAQEAGEAALQYAIELEDTLGLTRAYGALGTVFLVQGQDELALGCLQESLVVARRYGYHQEEARAVANLAGLALRVGTEPKAMESLLRDALELYTMLVEEDRMRTERKGGFKAVRQRGHRVRQGRLYGNLGQSMEPQSDDTASRAGYMYEAARGIATEEDDTLGEARADILLGAWQAKRGHLIHAGELLQSGLTVVDSCRNIQGQILAHQRTGQLLMQCERYQDAVKQFAAGHQVALGVGDLEREGVMSHEMGNAFDAMSKHVAGMTTMEGIPLEQQKNDAYSRVWLEYTRAEFFDAIEEFMKRGPGYEDSEKELARVAACLRFINSKIPGATAPYC